MLLILLIFFTGGTSSQPPVYEEEPKAAMVSKNTADSVLIFCVGYPKLSGGPKSV